MTNATATTNPYQKIHILIERAIALDQPLITTSIQGPTETFTVTEWIKISKYTPTSLDSYHKSLITPEPVLIANPCSWPHRPASGYTSENH